VQLLTRIAGTGGYSTVILIHRILPIEISQPTGLLVVE